ncbi:alkylglycerol monooxygenase [Trichonephila clavipes]|nr:alkylglycerol monooxygenase [Trichonephila clavipes]
MAKDVLSFLPYLGWRVWHVSESSPDMITCKPIFLRLAWLIHRSALSVNPILLEGWKLASYIYIYSNWRIVTLPWDSIWTWWAAFFIVDFLYYWAHRASHGRNRYCIDKNYAGVLIIWDRIFGTFEPESEKVVYGLTHPINSFEPMYIQVIRPLILYGAIIYQVFSLSVLGMILDARSYAAWLELVRCILYIAADYYFIPWTRLPLLNPVYQMAILSIIRISFLASTIIWLRHCIKSVTIRWHSKKLE